MLHSEENLSDENLPEEKNEYYLDSGQPARIINKSQKIAVAVLAVFALLVIGMWMVQFKKGLTKPFAYQGSDNNQAGVCVGPECEENEIDLKNKDTDNDGLSDWDELNNYKTSPYLEDSDSDGFSDKEEIDSDNDPNCPKGRNCYPAVSTDSSDQNNSKINLPSDQTDKEFNLDKNISQEQINQLENVISGQSDVASLRKMLIKAGMDKEILDEISDEDLMSSYAEVLAGE